jgi:hypothetical protein
MKTTLIAKISPIVEMTSPTLLQCKDGECGGCPKDTGKMLWVPKLWQVGTIEPFNFQYNFFNKSAESEAPIKYNWVESSTPYGDRPTKQYAIDTPAIESYMSPSQMRLGDTLQLSIDVYQSQSVGFWCFFRQPNPAINNIHDALCFEYNHEKRLVTFRSF